jgi:hypothetical protein
MDFILETEDFLSFGMRRMESFFRQIIVKHLLYLYPTKYY